MNHLPELARIVFDGVVAFVAIFVLATVFDLIRRALCILWHRSEQRRSMFRITSWPAAQQRPDRRTR